MAFELLRTDYVDAVFEGLRRYLVSDNGDGTVSFHDVTNYTVKEGAFFGAKDANTINTAVNAILASLNNGTDLYEVFIQFFETQKELFKNASDTKQEDFEAYITELCTYMDGKWDELKAEYTGDIQYFKDVQENAFNVWFQMVRDQLTSDVAGHLQQQIGNLTELETEDKSSLTGAINEIVSNPVWNEAAGKVENIHRATFNKTASATPDIELDCTFDDLKPGDLILINAVNTYNTSAYVTLSTYPYITDGTGERRQIKCQCAYVTQNTQSYRSTTNRGININFNACNLYTYVSADANYTGGVFYSLNNIYFSLSTTSSYKTTSSNPITGTGANNMYTELTGEISNCLKCVETGKFTNDTVTIQLKYDASYLLVTRELNINTQKVYGYRARMYAVSNETETSPQAANLCASSNTGVTLGTGTALIPTGVTYTQVYTITLKANSTYEVSYALYEFRNTYWELK